ncbi:MAG: nicotinamide mononucleotide transporter family protein [Proteobacteria bacterium]|nr:nicotinamide mononucleotide transporter family protein [Pseudomonadota bacterium]
MIDPTWALTAASVIGAALNAVGRRAGFTVWIFSNIGWVIANASRGLWPQAGLFVAYLGFSVVGFFMWPSSSTTKTQKEVTHDAAL